MRSIRKLKRNTQLQAALFVSFLVLFVCTSIAVAYAASGPIILGTELNANGTVEYMCMGLGCENLELFSWSDVQRGQF